jgi:hypothetical protein
MMFWPVLNMICGLIVAAILAYKLALRPASFTLMERAGMGLLGGGMVLTIGPIMAPSPTPFEDWSATLVRLGCVVYFTGRMLKHRHANRAAVRQAHRHLRR